MTCRSLRFSTFNLDLQRMSFYGPSGAIKIRPKSFEVLRYLAEHSGRVASKEEIITAVWPDVTVTEDSLTRCISEIRCALGNQGPRIIKTIPRRGYIIDVPVLPDTVAKVEDSEHPSRTDRRQEIRYCRSPDGVHIAYAVSGNGPPLVKAGNWLHHLQYDWESPVWRHVLQGLSEHHTVIRYDARGNGLSDWDVDNLSFDAWLTDLETITAATGVERFPLLGISQGCAISVAYAVRHPERVSHLILYGGYVLGAKKRTPEDRDKRNAMLTLARLEWGADNPAFRQLFTGNFIPGATRQQADFFNELQRRTTTPECAARYMDVTGDFDISDLLSQVTAPTLVMHVRGDLMVPVEQGKALAAGIADARFVVFEGQNHFFLEGEPASIEFFEEIELFLKE